MSQHAAVISLYQEVGLIQSLAEVLENQLHVLTEPLKKGDKHKFTHRESRRTCGVFERGWTDRHGLSAHAINKIAYRPRGDAPPRGGEATALVGPSGSGKSTVCRLAACFWDPGSGRVLLGGADERGLDPDEVLARMAIVFQDVSLFQGTVADNIRMVRADATDEEVREAARRAAALDFIEALPWGFDTPRGEGGSTLSGGERQRVSIARALLKDAPVVLLDALNEVTVQSAITELVRGRTVAVIAHRLRSIRDADRIFVIDGAGRRPGDPRRAHGPLRPLPAPVGGAGAGRGLADSEAPSIAAWAGTLALNAGGAAQPINPHGRPLPPANHTVAQARSLHPAECGAEQPARRPKQDSHSPPPRAPRRRAPRHPSSRASSPWRRTAPPGTRTGSPARGARRP